MNIAIDGPAGAGKSTIAKILAEKLGMNYIDTGAMYRAITLKAIENNIDFNDVSSLINLVNNTDIKISNGRIYLDSKDVTDKIRTPLVSQKVSKIAAISEIREKMICLQRELAENGNVIMDGRDIGTVVLPNASLKFFITATVEERAKRRFLELKAKGYDVNYDNIKKEILSRDEQDMKRKISPLKLAEDAIVIDTSNKEIEEIIQEILQQHITRR
ncbi:Cytidylate kinase [Koleobacter methoxysyntrophicus]|uniref:Cytidylate kinase n=1 Tax=Koleobacter methoxysyntrophicus TaxID=2751313 RepID=A0A8A0RNZ1_9FIRM|nr:(d)CMP kinase [Koleobacter methoxysyntrophicus]QSQ10121.1 Cytidylate kinase [Koleobacter methoxysyntrophicus]